MTMDAACFAATSHTNTVSDFQDTASLKAGSVRCTTDPVSTSLIKRHGLYFGVPGK